jgi:hypothetical protein
MRARIVLVWSFILLVGNATAADWRYVTATDNAQIFMDFDSTVYQDGDKVKAWFLYEYGGPQLDSGNRKYLSSKRLVYFDCFQHSMVTVQSIRYGKESGSGDVVSTVSTPLSRAVFEDVVPETIGETMQQVACFFAVRRQ